jgi:transcriptional regulator with XRE-family HTH domain
MAIQDSGEIHISAESMMNVEPKDGLRDRIRAAMQFSRVSMAEAGRAAGLSRATVSLWLHIDRGRRTKPNIESLLNFSRALSVPFTWLYRGVYDERMEKGYQDMLSLGHDDFLPAPVFSPALLDRMIPALNAATEKEAQYREKMMEARTVRPSPTGKGLDDRIRSIRRASYPSRAAAMRLVYNDLRRFLPLLTKNLEREINIPFANKSFTLDYLSQSYALDIVPIQLDEDGRLRSTPPLGFERHLWDMAAVTKVDQQMGNDSRRHEVAILPFSTEVNEEVVENAEPGEDGSDQRVKYTTHINLMSHDSGLELSRSMPAWFSHNHEIAKLMGFELICYPCISGLLDTIAMLEGQNKLTDGQIKYLRQQYDIPGQSEKAENDPLPF